MNSAVAKFAKPFALTLALVTLTLAVAALAGDWVVEIRTASERAERLRLAEDAAREDPVAAEALQVEVERQTASSLDRGRRQRFAGVIALVSAGLCIALLKIREVQPRVPRCVADAVTRHENLNRSEDTAKPSEPDDLPRPTVDLSPVDTLVEQIGREQQHLIPLLHAVNQHYHYLPSPALKRLSESTRISHEQIAGVASFYAQFRTRPRGQHMVQVCRGTACHVAGADRILEELRRELRIPPGQDTDPNGIVTMEAVGCLGCCTLAPVVDVDRRIEGHVSVQALPEMVDWSRAKCSSSGGAGRVCSADKVAMNGDGDPAAQPLEIRIGLGSCCVAGGSRDVMDCLEQEIAARHLNAVIKPVGCVGICHLTPMVEVVAPGAEPIVATRATPADVRKILRAIPGKAPWPQRWRNLLTDVWRRQEPSPNGSASTCQISRIGDDRLRRFIDPQIRIVTEHSGEMDPASLSQYRARDGFIALERCLRQQQPTSIVEAIELSGLRGRGGGGYPTAAKWRKLSQAPGEKILICNGDEGDPGAFMDRMVMESYPFRVLEGMAIAAYAVGAHHAYLYVRHEYPLEIGRAHV